MSAGKDDFLFSIKAILQDFYKDREDVAAVYLFGSILGPIFSDQSDIDIGVLYQPNRLPDFDLRLQEQAELSDQLKVQVDLVALNRVSPILGYQVLKYGENILRRDRRAADLFFVRTLNEYFDLKTNRKVIERSLQNVRIL